MAGIVDEKAAAGRQQRQQPRDGDNTGPTASADLQLPDLTPGADEGAPPPYGENHNQVHFSQPGFDAGAEVTGAFCPSVAEMRLD